MKQQLNEIKRMQQLASITEIKVHKTNQGFRPNDEQSFVEFVNLVAKNIFPAGVNDPTMTQVNDWDTLFEYWEDFGDLYLHTQSDIIQLARQANVSQDDIDYILDLPQVSNLERG